jgi:glycosyltransferase involved in cell wall biosynthesis
MGDLLTDEAALGVAAPQHAPVGAARIRVGMRPLRVLFFNEGNFGTHVLGHAQLERALRGALREGDGIEARFAELSPMPRLANAAATRAIEPLRRADLDLQTLRWHVVQSLRARSQLGRKLAAWTPDVVHLYTPAVALMMGSAMRRVPFVLSMDTTVRDWSQMPAWRSSRPYAGAVVAPSARLEKRALERAALVLARTAWVRRSVERIAPGVRVLEHHPGIDLERYRPADREPRARARVLFVGGRFLAKGGGDLLAALDGELGRTVELDVVTPDPVPARVGVRVHRLEPGETRLLELQRQADLMCLPSRGDTNPWAILEAMACGTPVVASAVGGIPDMLDDGRAGVLVPTGDVAALREALLALLADRPRRRALGATARLRCELHYDSRRQFQQLLRHLRSVA